MFSNLYPAELASKIKPIKKLYYNSLPYSGFPYKIVFVCDVYGSDQAYKEPPPELETFTSDINKWLRKVYKQKYEYPSNLKDRDGPHRTLFLQDCKNFNIILEKFGKYVKAAERPIDQEHYKMLHEGDKLLFRPQYFWGKYEYKVGLKSSPDLLIDHIPWLQGFFKERNSLDYKFNSSIERALRPHLNGINIYSTYSSYRRKKHYYYGHNIFLKHKEDVMMVKLKIGKDVHFVERIVKFENLNKLATNIVDEKTN